MRNVMVRSVIVSAWCVAAPLAQEKPAPPPNPVPAHNIFVMTGCLEEGAAANATFKLTNASSIGRAPRAGSPDGSAVGTSGQKTTYELRAVSGVNAQGLDADALNAHVGQRVELVVRPIESPAAPPAAGVGAVQSAKPIEPVPERYSVTEIKRVIGTCR